MKNFNKTITLFLVFAMALTFNPLQSTAKYKNQSGDLPGTVSDGTIYALAGVAVVGIGVLVYVLINKNKQDKSTGAVDNHKTMETILWENQINALAKDHASAGSISHCNETNSIPNFSVLPQNTLAQQIENAKKTIPINLVVAPLTPLNSTNFAIGQTNGIQVGMRIRF